MTADAARLSHASKPQRASLCYSTRNIGDDIQTFAVRQYFDGPIKIDRDRLNANPASVELVLNGWLLHGNQWPPRDNLKVHPVGVHVAPAARKRIARHIDWWRQFEVVSCRDSSTAEFFCSLGTVAVFEGCATLSLKRWLETETGLAVFVDANQKSRWKMPEVHFERIEHLTHWITPEQQNDQEFRQSRTLHLLEAYQRAELVVTSRLHAALPCLAFGTPVCFIPPDMTRPPNYTRLLDYLPWFNIAAPETQQKFESERNLPVNFRPEAIIEKVTKRLENISKHGSNSRISPIL